MSKFIVKYKLDPKMFPELANQTLETEHYDTVELANENQRDIVSFEGIGSAWVEEVEPAKPTPSVARLAAMVLGVFLMSGCVIDPNSDLHQSIKEHCISRCQKDGATYATLDSHSSCSCSYALKDCK